MEKVTITTNDLMSVQDAARALKQHRYQIYRWIDAGKILAIKLGGIIFVPVSEIERLKAEKQIEPAGDCKENS